MANGEWKTRNPSLFAIRPSPFAIRPIPEGKHIILANTIASAPVQGVSVQAAADDNPILGSGVVGTGRNWVSTAGVANAVLAALDTPTAGATINLDWTAAGLFTVTMPSSGTSTFQFATTATAASAAASQVLSAALGQLILVQITGTSGVTVAWPTTITWIGAASAAAPTLTGNTTLIWLICTGVGSAPSFTGFYLTS